MTSDTTLSQDAPKGNQNEKKNADTAQQVENRKNADAWKQAGVGVATGAAAGAASAWATHAAAAEPQPEPQPELQPEVEQEPQLEPEPEPQPASQPQSEPREPEPREEPQPETQTVPESEPIQQESDTDPSVNVVNDAELEKFELDGVRIVGTGEIEGHFAVAYDVNADEDPDVAIVDVDDSGDISASDVVLDDEGNMATVGDICEVSTQQEEDCCSANMPENEDPSLVQNPDVAPDMPDYMNDAVVDV
ncbi:MAG: hypothetical protein IKN22_01760 [Bacteroidaceae bacterium]|nr:hypothetical protein [Bacteroidaceae bacterium]